MTRTGAGGRPLLAATIQQIFEERAKALAEPLQMATSAGSDLQLVVIALGDERFGVDSRWVQEVQPMSNITSLPGIVDYWSGLVNLRGRLFPVLDLNRYLATLGFHYAKPAGHSSLGRIVLVHAAGMEVALSVDDVPEVRRVSCSDVGPCLAENEGGNPSLLAGITSDLLSLLDLDVLLGDPRLIVQD